MDIISIIEQVPTLLRSIYALTLFGMAMVVFTASDSGIRADFFWGFLITLLLVVFVMAVYWGVSTGLIDIGAAQLADLGFFNLLPVIGGFFLILFKVTRRSESHECSKGSG
jgi:hypothetical protein